ncbi:MAG: nucleoside deaminase [Chitinispirillaceae bacterium]|nr:nucleoside deaminase [Chitinispirillaceae bacterium]
MTEHEKYMQLAYKEALKAYNEGEVPVGAVIVKDNQVIGRGYNRMEKLSDATAHAEIIAISAASSNLPSWRLNGATIYVTLEPCIMCLGAILHSRIDEIVYGAKDERFGAIFSHSYKEELEKVYSYFPTVTSLIMAEESSLLIKRFFAEIRKKNKEENQ